MRPHTNDFKQEISKMGRQIKARLFYYNTTYLKLEDAQDEISFILTEDDNTLASERVEVSQDNRTEINETDIFSISILKNGDILKSLMKQLNFEIKNELPLGIVVNAQFGVLVDEDYEYLDYGNFIIREKSYNLDTETWSYVCYDKMLYSMIDYKLNVTYPITIGNYLKAICEKIGVGFENQRIGSLTWIPENFSQLIYSDVFEDKGLKFRDVLDKIAEVLGGNLLINDNDNMTIKRLTPFSNEEKYHETVGADFLKDFNVSFDKKVGPINQIAIVDTDANLEFDSPIYFPSGVGEQNVYKLEIKDNELAFNGQTSQIASNLLLELSQLEYYINDFTTTGICYFDYLDRFKINYKGQDFPCLLLNNEITITQGIEETIFTDENNGLSNDEDIYDTSIPPSDEVAIMINKQQAEIQSKVSKSGVISAINQTPEQIQIQANKIKLEGYTTINDGFNIDEQGKMTANGGVFNGLINAGKIEVNGYSESDPFVTVGWNDETPSEPYGVNIWDTGVSAIDYRDGHEPLIRTEGASGSYAQLKGNHCDAFAFNNVSLAEKKEDFEPLISGLDIIKDIDIYKYHYKNSSSIKKRIGLVIGEDFKYSKEITNDKNTDVDLYSFISVCCRAIQEQQNEINKLKEMILKNGKC